VSSVCKNKRSSTGFTAAGTLTSVYYSSRVFTKFILHNMSLMTVMIKLY